MKKIVIGGAAAAAILASGAAFGATQTTKASQPQAGRHARAMQPMTRAEVQSRIPAIFAKVDINHDGFVTKDELNAVESQREQKAEQRAERFDPSKVFDRLDANHDGKVTVAEANAARSQRAQAKGGTPAQAQATTFTRLLARADINKDNVLTRTEFDAMGQQLKARMEHSNVARGGMAVRMFDRDDGNKDGRVTLAEMQQAALAQFDRADLNHDGTITPQERQLFKAHPQPGQAPTKH